jgi:neurotransmitter:Na+ symporter, NSS family
MTTQREHWGSRLGFIMATAGSAIGLGSLWRFPYITGQNGGGAFVLLYLVFTLLIGIPIFLGELIVGRSAQKSSVSAYSNLSQGSQWSMVGWLNIFTNLLILSYYSVVSGWSLNYALMSLNNFTAGKTPAQIEGIFSIMYQSPDINLLWHFIFMLLTAGVVYSGVRKGIEYWSKILTPALLVILVGLFIFALFLPGFPEALKFILYPDFSKLGPNGVLNALGMSFFTLSVGLGILVTYGSYMGPNEDIPKTGFIIGAVSVLVSLFAALMIFPIVFSFGFEPEGGPGLVFKTLPVLFAKMPATLVLSTVFFTLFVFTALTSSISIIEVLVSNLMEIFKWSRKKSVVICASAAFILGIPTALAGSGILFPNWSKMYNGDFFDTINYLTGSWMMPLGGLLAAIFVGWRLDRQLATAEFKKGSTLTVLAYGWIFLLKWVAPVGVFIVILQEGGIIDINKLLG